MDNPDLQLGYIVGATAARLVLHWLIALANFILGAATGRLIWVFVGALAAVAWDYGLGVSGLGLGGSGTGIGAAAEFIAVGLGGYLGIIARWLWKRHRRLPAPDPATFE